jgi:hypothetical protein
MKFSIFPETALAAAKSEIRNRKSKIPLVLVLAARAMTAA